MGAAENAELMAGAEPACVVDRLMLAAAALPQPSAGTPTQNRDYLHLGP